MSVVTKPLQDFDKTSVKTHTRLLSRDYSTPIKTLQNFYQERSYSTTTLQDTHQQNDRILEFYSPMYVSHPTLDCHLLLVPLNKNTFQKMAEASFTDLFPEVSYDPPKSDAKRQKLIECVLTRKSKQYLAKAYTEE